VNVKLINAEDVKVGMWIESRHGWMEVESVELNSGGAKAWVKWKEPVEGRLYFGPSYGDKILVGIPE